MNALMNNEFTKWFMICVTQKYADFNGRARRKEYWMFVLVAMIISFILGLISGLTGLIFVVEIAPGVGVGYGILNNLFSLAIIVPSIAAGIRRMHDTGRSGWFILVPLYNLYLLITDSTPGENRFGPNPKGM